VRAPWPTWKLLAAVVGGAMCIVAIITVIAVAAA